MLWRWPNTPKSKRKEVQSLTPDQARTILAAIEQHRHYALIVVAVSYGLREGEILGLRWQDLDLERGVLRLRHQLERLPKTPSMLVEPKEEELRTIKLPAPVIPILREQRVRQLEQRLAAGDRWQDRWVRVLDAHGDAVRRAEPESGDQGVDGGREGPGPRLPHVSGIRAPASCW